jgi:hypothetical protein
MLWKSKSLSAVALIVLTATVAVGASSSAGASTRHTGNKLAGAWIVHVVPPAPRAPVTSLQVYTRDGSVIESGNDGSASRSPAYGTWERIEGRLYANTTVFFRFDPATGAFIGSLKVSRTIRLAEDGQSFAVAGRVSVLDPNGNVLGSFPVTGTAERMQVERIADMP